MKRLFPLLPRKKDSDKSRFGHVLVIAGSLGMPGAARLVSEACARSGAGLVTVALPKSVLKSFARKSIPEVMLADRAKLAPLLKRVNCLAVGPGLGREERTFSLVRKLVRTSGLPIVLDADGLNAFKGDAARLKKHRAALVLTPHRGEFERLFGRPWPSKESERAVLAKKLSRFYDVVLVMKGHRTLVAGGGDFYRNTTGNPGMAKGGSGDVLTGMIAAFIAQGLKPFPAAAWAVHFHGRAGDLAARQKGELSLLPSDLIDALPRAFGRR